MSDRNVRAATIKTWSKEYTYGPGYDCELCGFTPDRLTAERLPDGSYAMNVKSGCTGGLYTRDVSSEDALITIQKWCEEMKHDPELVECLKDLSKKITKDIRKEKRGLK